MGKAAEGDFQVTQMSGKGVDGGVTLRVPKKGSPTVVGADLVVESLVHSPQDPTIEDQITFTAVIKNIGVRRADPSTLSFRVGGETPPGKTFAVPALEGGATFSVSRQEILGTAQNYRNTVIVDLKNEITESNEANNQRTDDYTVSPRR